MRFALVSDIHANLPAWEAVLKDIHEHEVDSILCLGDVVGYGPMPEIVLMSVCEAVDEIVLGNHDAVVGGRMEEDCFSDEARRVIDWTRSLLDDSATELLSTLPSVVEGDGFLLAHGEVFDPERFGYIESEEEARENFYSEATPLIFVGHTHYPGIFAMDLRNTTIRSIVASDFRPQPQVRYIVNVGSVGDPRDGTTLATYCIYDDHKGEVIFRKVQFNMESYRRDLAERGLNILPQFLDIARGASGPSLPAEQARDWSVQAWKPGEPKVRRAAAARVRRVEQGMTDAEEAAAAETQARRQRLAGTMRAAQRQAEEERQARAEATREALRRKQDEVEAARRQREDEEAATAEVARQRKAELAKAIMAREEEKERQRREAKARTEELLARKRALAQEQKSKEEMSGTKPAEGQVPARRSAGERPATGLGGGKMATVKKDGSAKADIPIFGFIPPSQEKVRPVLETASDDEEPVEAEVAVATEEEIARKRRLALARAAEEKKLRRREEYKASVERRRMMIQMKREAALRAKGISGEVPPAPEAEAAALPAEEVPPPEEIEELPVPEVVEEPDTE